MKKMHLVQNILRLIVTVLVIVMLFLPLFSFKVTSLSKEKRAQITAMGLIAVDRGDMTMEEFQEMLEPIAPLFAEAEMIYMGYDADGDELPFDLEISTEHPEYLEDSDYPEKLEDLKFVIQNEIGEAGDMEISFSVFSLIKSLVSGGAFAGRLITTNILEESELENMEGLSESEIQVRIKEVAENREKSGFSDSLISQLQAIGVVNSETWVKLSKLDTSDLNEEVMNLVWFLSSLNVLNLIVFALFLIIVIITLVVLVLSELIHVPVKRFQEKGARPGANLFQYCSPAVMIAAMAFLITGTELSPMILVLLGVVIACAFFYSFVEGSAKQGRGCGVFFWSMRVVTLLCVVACLLGVFTGLDFNAFETVVTEDAYEESVEKVYEKHEDEIKHLEREYEVLLTDQLNGADNSESIQAIEKSMEILQVKMKYESINGLSIGVVEGVSGGLLVKMRVLKLLVFFYFLLVASYLTFAIDRLGSMRSVPFPMALVSAKIPGKIVAAVFAAAIEILFFGGIVTVFAYIFAAFAVLEIAVAIFKKAIRKTEYNYVVRKGQELCDAGVIYAEDWNPAMEQLQQMDEKVTSLKMMGIVGTVDALFGQYEADEVPAEEIGMRLRDAFIDPVDVKKFKYKKK